MRTQGPGPAGLQRLRRERPPAGRHRPPAAESTRAADTYRAGQAPLALRPSLGTQAPEAGPHLPQQRSSGDARPDDGTEGAAGPPPAPSPAARALTGPALPCPPGPAALTRSPRACATAGRESKDGERGAGTLRMKAWPEHEVGVASCWGRGLAAELGEAGRAAKSSAPCGHIPAVPPAPLSSALSHPSVPWKPAVIDPQGPRDH